MQAPAGWYDDGRGALRYWDGAAWTEHTHQPAVPAAKPRGGNVAPWVWWTSGAVLAVVLISVVSLTIATAMRPNPNADVRAAVAAFDEAWLAEDCDALWSVTTSGYRDGSAFYVCEDFTLRAQDVNAEYEDYYVWVSSVDIDGTDARVSALESYYYDDEYSQQQVTYVLELQDGAWLVEDVQYPDQ